MLAFAFAGCQAIESDEALVATYSGGQSVVVRVLGPSIIGLQVSNDRGSILFDRPDLRAPSGEYHILLDFQDQPKAVYHVLVYDHHGDRIANHRFAQL